jgi:hypothetical protein
MLSGLWAALRRGNEMVDVGLGLSRYMCTTITWNASLFNASDRLIKYYRLAARDIVIPKMRITLIGIYVSSK